MINSRLCWVKMQLWSIYNQTSSFFVNIKILKLHSSFDQGMIMIHQETLKIIKSQKLLNWGFLKEKSTELWPSITFTYFIKNFTTKSNSEGNSILYNFVSYRFFKSNASFERYGPRHYRSFQKSTKSHFFSKKCTWTWKLQMGWNQR